MAARRPPRKPPPRSIAATPKPAQKRGRRSQLMLQYRNQLVPVVAAEPVPKPLTHPLQMYFVERQGGSGGFLWSARIEKRGVMNWPENWPLPRGATVVAVGDE